MTYHYTARVRVIYGGRWTLFKAFLRGRLVGAWHDQPPSPDRPGQREDGVSYAKDPRPETRRRVLDGGITSM